LLLAGVGVQRDDHVGGGADVEGVADLQRGVLVLAAAVGLLAGVEGPGDLQLLHVVAVDLVDRGVARAAGIAAVVAPVGGAFGDRLGALGLHRAVGLAP